MSSLKFFYRFCLFLSLITLTISLSCVKKVYAEESYYEVEPAEILGSSAQWNLIASSSDGTKLVAASSHAASYIYTSTDSGISWVKRISAGTRWWNSINSSSDGSKLVASVYGGYIYTSSDFGATWVERTTSGTRNWFGGIASSSNGEKLAASVVGGYIYTSSDFGATWDERTTSGTRNWNSINSSSDGSKLVASVVGGYIYTSSDFGSTWVERTTSGTRNWSGSNVASSSNGEKLAASVSNGYIYTSSDFGSTWVERTTSGTRNWTGVASSSNGEKLVALVSGGGYIYTSSDYGATWVERTSSGFRNWLDLSSSFDGTKLYAITKGYVYKSTDSGVSWTEGTNRGIDTGIWDGVASSSDGSKLAAVSSGGYVYTSTDSGNSWVKRTSSGARNWIGITSSSDGTMLATVVNGGYIYTSTDSGVTWEERTSAGFRNWYGITSSSNGEKLAASVYGGYIYTSSDSGVTWEERTSAGSRYWRLISSSSNGEILVAAVSGGYIYTSPDWGETWYERTSSGSRYWSGITVSADGTRMAAVRNRGYVYTSSNSGETWSAQTGSGVKNHAAIVSSSDGSKLMSITTGGYSYYSENYGVTWRTMPNIISHYATSIDASSDMTKFISGGSNSYLFIGNLVTDSVSPEITLTNFENNETNDPTPVFSGIVEDTQGYISKVEFQLDGTEGDWEECTFEEISDTESFENSSFPPDGYTISGSALWERNTLQHYQGNASAASVNVVHYGSAKLNKSITFDSPVMLSFYWKVSSEDQFDHLKFCLDRPDCTAFNGGIEQISGTIDWVKQDVAIPSGTHNLTWAYAKDWNTSAGSDLGWIDNIYLTSNHNYTCGNSDILPEGDHTIYMRATDSHENTTDNGSLYSYDFTVDYNILVTESSDSTVISEDGLNDTISIQLSSIPQNDVVVKLASVSNLMQIVPNTLTFTPFNWDTPQTVTLSTIDNNKTDEVEYNDEITFTLESDDADFDGDSVNPFNVTILDHDYGDRISNANEGKIVSEIEIKNINGVNSNEFTDVNGDENTKKAIIFETKPSVEFKRVGDDISAKIDKYTIKLQKTDDLGRPQGSYFDWIKDIDHKSKDTNLKIKKDGYSISYKNGRIRIKVLGDEYKLDEKTYFMRIKVYDNAGNSALSDKIKLIVKNPGEKFELLKIGTLDYVNGKYQIYHYTQPFVEFFGSAVDGSKVSLIVDGSEVSKIESVTNSEYYLPFAFDSGISSVQIKSGDKEYSFSLNIDPERKSFPEYLKSPSN